MFFSQSIEPTPTSETSANALQKPIQVVQPIQTACPSPVPVQPIVDQTGCLNPLVMAAPVSSPMVTFMPTSGAPTLAQPVNCPQNNAAAAKQTPNVITQPPFVYQGVPVGQPILLAK